MKPEEMLQKMQDALNQVSEKIAKSVTERDEQIKALGAADEKTGAIIEKYTKQYDQLVTDVEGFKKNVEDIQKRLGRIGELDQEQESMKSIGEMFTDSKAYTDMIEGRRYTSDRVKYKSLRPSGKKALTSILSGGVRLIEPYRAPMLELPQRPMSLRNFIRSLGISSDAVQYVEEVGYAPLYTTVKTASSIGDTTIELTYAGGFHPKQEVMVGTEKKVIAVGGVDYENNIITLTTGLAVALAVGASVTANSIAATPERIRKPMADINLRLGTEAVKIIAHWIAAPRQMLDDMPRLRDFIDRRLIYGLELAEEWHLLYGDGSDRQLQGILTHAARQIYTWSSGSVGDTKIDAIRRGMTKVMLTNYQADGIVLHPNDWEDIELTKGSDQHYIWINVVLGGEQRLWRVPVVATQAITEGTAAVGAWGLASTIYDREDANVRVAEQHADFFVENMVAILAEERLAHVIERPESFCEVRFDNAPVAPLT